MEKILAVVLNWKRPVNVCHVIDNLRRQSVPVHVAVVECSPGKFDELRKEVTDLADSVFSIRDNLGPCSRFLPPLMLPQFKYTYFAVDDHLPGPRHVECLVRCAESRNGDFPLRFATIGQDGRHVINGQIIKRRAKLDPAGPTPVDVVTSSELIETARIPAVARWRQRMVAEWGDEGRDMLFEDDLILCMALRANASAPSYLTPACEPDEWWSVRRLPSPHALCARPDHAERRDRFVAKAIEFGWFPRQ